MNSLRPEVARAKVSCLHLPLVDVKWIVSHGSVAIQPFYVSIRHILDVLPVGAVPELGFIRQVLIRAFT